MIIFHRGLLKMYELNPVFDDLFMEVNNSAAVQELFVFSARKANISVIFITQNLFESGKHGVTIRKNTDYFVVFSGFGDSLNVRTINHAFFDSKRLQG